MSPAEQAAIRDGAYAAGAGAAAAGAFAASDAEAFAGPDGYPQGGGYDGPPEADPFAEAPYDDNLPEDEYPEEDDGGSSGLEKAVTIGGFIVAAVIIAILIYFIGRAAGLFNFGGSGTPASSDTVITSAPVTDTPTPVPASSSEPVSSVVSSAVSSVESVVTEAPTPVPTVEVPGIVGHTESDARTIAAQAGLKLRYVSERTDNNNAASVVIEQDPAPGTTVEVGTEIRYVRSTGPEQKYVPNAINMTEEEARQVMYENGFTNIHFAYYPNPAFEAGRVCSISPSVGRPEDVSTLITLYVSTGPVNTEPTPTPTEEPAEPTPEPAEPTPEPAEPVTVIVRNYTGIPLADAQAQCAEDGLTVSLQETNREGSADGIVLEQSIPPQTESQRGATIILLVNRAPQQPQPQPEAGGNWVTNTVLESAEGYTGGHYILNIVQYVGNNRVEKQISEGDGLAFPFTLTAQGEAGVPDGQAVLYELRDGSYQPVKVWDNIPFGAS